MAKDKHDFAGKNKTSDTYTGDWVFVKNRHTKGPNDSAGAWMTKQQRKQVMQDRHQNASQAAAAPGAAAAPAAPGTVAIPMPGVPPTTVPYGNDAGVFTKGGLGVPTNPNTPTGPYTPIPTLPVPGAGGSGVGRKTSMGTAAPSWWNPIAYNNPTTEDQKFANIANALLPSLAPEDQRTLAMYLAQNNKDVYGGYADANFGTAPTQITDQIRNQFLSPQRAQQTLALLDRMKTAAGGADLGAGYDYLRNAVGLINQFSGNGGPMTREMYQQFTNAVNNLGKNATGALAPYGNLAQLFNLPQFSAGPLMSNTPNNNLFG